MPRTARASDARVEALLNPRNVVIVGATDRPGSWTIRVRRNLAKYGYAGAVYPFNPARDHVWQTRCYQDFSQLPEPPDHLVVLAPARAVPEVLRKAALAGARSATVMSSGFEEAEGAVGKHLGEALRQVILETGMALSGPNCMGNIAAPARLVTCPDDRPQIISPGPVAVIGQSGGLVMALKRTLEDRGNICGYSITSGNETGLTSADYIRYFASEPTIRVIVCYLESVHDTEGFLEACQAARRAGKPVVVMKLGASAAGRAAAQAHTGSLAGAMEVFDAVAGAAGAVRARTMDEVIELVEYFLHAPLPKGSGLGAITFSGGLRGLCLDAAHVHGLHFPDLAPRTRKRLEAVLGVGSIIGNPLDAGFAALSSVDAYLESVRALLADPGIDTLLLQEELPRASGVERKEGYLRAVNEMASRKGTKPVAYFSMISYGLTDYSRSFRDGLPHVPFLQEVDKSLSAIKRVTNYAAARKTRPAVIETKPPPAILRRTLASLPISPPSQTSFHRTGFKVLSEVQSKALLKGYGLRLPKEQMVHSAREAAEVARQIGFPVVMKGISPGIIHKSDVGAVLLDVANGQQARAGYSRVIENMKRHAPDAWIEGVLVAEQAQAGLEVVIGATRDPEMGPVMMFGAGGVTLELYKDVAFAAPPLDEAAAERLIASTRTATRLAGYRGQKPYDHPAVVKALVALSRLVADLGEAFVSVEINPLLVLAKGDGALALDGLVVLQHPSSGEG